jgi:hypothetical protein
MLLMTVAAAKGEVEATLPYPMVGVVAIVDIEHRGPVVVDWWPGWMLPEKSRRHGCSPPQQMEFIGGDPTILELTAASSMTVPFFPAAICAISHTIGKDPPDEPCCMLALCFPAT